MSECKHLIPITTGNFVDMLGCLDCDADIDEVVMSYVVRAEQAEALLERIRQVAIHTPQGNAVIPSSMILEKGDE